MFRIYRLDCELHEGGGSAVICDRCGVAHINSDGDTLLKAVCGNNGKKGPREGMGIDFDGPHEEKALVTLTPSGRY